MRQFMSMSERVKPALSCHKRGDGRFSSPRCHLFMSMLILPDGCSYGLMTRQYGAHEGKEY